MDARVTPVLLWLRAVVAGSVAFTAGTVGHVSAGGLLPHWLVVADLYAGCVLASAWFLSRPSTARRLVAMTAGGQAVTHLALSLFAGHGPEAAPHGHGLSGLVAHVRADAGMMTVHLGAACLLGWWLAWGEGALWAFLALWRHRRWWAPLVTLPVLPQVHRPARSVLLTARPLPSSVLVRAVSWRGPPGLRPAP